jgi:hypothetical protein
VCDCVVCKGIIGTNLTNLSQFGDQHYSTPQSKRLAQTPAAAKRCRFHFLLRRVAERDWVRKASLDDIVNQLEASRIEWGRIRVLRDDAAHLQAWVDVLRG